MFTSLFKPIRQWPVWSLKVLGACLIFFSWVTQNYFEGQIKQDRHRLLQLAQLAAHHHEMAVHFEHIFRSERTKEKPDRGILRDAGINYIIFGAHQVQIAEQGLRESGELTTEQEQIAGKIMKLAQNTRHEMDAAELVTSVEDFADYYATMMMMQKPLADTRYTKLLEMESFANNTFMILYIAGSFIIAIGFVLAKPEDDKRT